jgi:hypothetical protein
LVSVTFVNTAENFPLFRSKIPRGTLAGFHSSRFRYPGLFADVSTTIRTLLMTFAGQVPDFLIHRQIHQRQSDLSQQMADAVPAVSSIAVRLRSDAGWLTLRVADDGKGMDLKHLSDPEALG